jgi:hypothetical protein
MINLTNALSDISRTNQIKIMQSHEEVAEKLFQYLYKSGKGIEYFSIKGWYAKDDRPRNDKQASDSFFRKRHKDIKQEIQKRLAEYGEKPDLSSIQYFLSYADGANYVFFLSPNNTHSGWKQLFSEKWGTSNRERIFNLVFKFYILSQGLPSETINGFEELLLVHSKNLSEKKGALLVWGQNLFVKYNHHRVLTLTLSRRSMRFLPKDQYGIMDGDDIGELLIHKKNNYYFERKRDARSANSIMFMRFDSKDENYEKFKQTQLYHHHNLISKLEGFLEECNITFAPLHFQANFYLENPFIKNIEAVQSLEFINNTGHDLTEINKKFLANLLKYQGVQMLTFYNDGKSISKYSLVEGEDDLCWEISECVPWSDVVLDRNKNYLVFNRQFDEESGSMAYQREDGLWTPSSDISEKTKVDFYSQLKRRFNYLDSGEFFSTQGINLSKFWAVRDSDGEDTDDTTPVLVYNHIQKKVDRDTLFEDAKGFTSGRYLDTDDLIVAYISGQDDISLLKSFIEKHNIKITPEFQKVLIELGIKNWIKEGIGNPDAGLPVDSQAFSEKHIFTIYVRSPRNQETKTVAVEFVYRNGFIYIKDIMRDPRKVMSRFPFLKTRKNQPNILMNDQEYFVDEDSQIYINCYTDDNYTPTLIGRTDILQNLADRTLEVNRQTKEENSSRLLPLVSYYNGDIKPANRIQNMICFDLKNETFIQYYVPSGKGLERTIKRGFRVYHLIGKTYDKQDIPTSNLINHPITALHFSTLTQNILKISENSQSSLLQKVARVLVEN